MNTAEDHPDDIVQGVHPKTASRLPPLTVHDLSDEILQIIFEIFRRHEEGAWSGSWLRITFICRHWRYLAISTKSLWTSLEMNWSDKDRLATFLDRSVGIPVSLSFGWARESDHRPFDNLEVLASVKALLRVKKLFLKNLDSDLSNDILYALPSVMPDLEHLSVKEQNNGLFTAYAAETLPLTAVSCLRLQAITLRHTLNFPLLTRLTIMTSYACVSSHLLTLANSPLLEKL